MGTNCAPILVDCSVIEAVSFHFTFRYKHDKDYVISLNNSKCGDYVELIYPNELKVKDNTDTVTSASYLDLHKQITKDKNLLQKRGLWFPNVNFPFLCSIIPAAPAYGVHVSRLIRYSRACITYHEFHNGRLLLTSQLLNEEFQMVKLKSFLRKFTDAITIWLIFIEYQFHR